MNFEVKHQDDITIFKLNEKQMNSHISGLLKGEFTILIQADNVRKLVIDMSEVVKCDSSGLSALLLAQREVREKGGALRLINVNDEIKHLIKLSFLENVLPICSSYEEAVQQLENIE